MAPTHWSNNIWVTKEGFLSEMDISFWNFRNSCMNRVPQIPPLAHGRSYLLSGFQRGMQLVLAPLSCLLGEELVRSNTAPVCAAVPQQPGVQQCPSSHGSATWPMESAPARLHQGSFQSSYNTERLVEGILGYPSCPLCHYILYKTERNSLQIHTLSSSSWYW